MNPTSATSSQNSRGRLVLPYEINWMILRCLSLDELISHAKAVDYAWKETLDIVSKGMLSSLGLSSPATQSEKRRQKKVRKSINKEVAAKACADSYNNALADLLSTRMSGRRLKVAHLKELSHCHLVVPQLRELYVFPHSNHIRWVKKIHRLNPEIKWHFLVISGDLGKINDPKLLDGLKGSLDIVMESQEDVYKLKEICKKSHPDFKLKLKITPQADVRLQDLIGSSCILKQLARLTAVVRREKDFLSLDAACKDYRFDAVLAIADSCHLLQECAHLPSSLVDLEMLYPTREELLWVEKVGKQSKCQLALRSVDNIQTVRNFTNSRWALRDLAIETPLNSDADVTLFKEICKAHPNMTFKITLGQAELLEHLHDIPVGMDLFLYSGMPIFCRASNRTCTSDTDDDDVDNLAIRWQPRHVQQNLEISCDSDSLRYVQSLDLQRSTKFSFFLTEDDFDCKLLVDILSKCSNLKQLLIGTGISSRDFGELPVLLQKALDHQSWPCLELLTICSFSGNFFNLKLPNFTKKTGDNMWRWRNKYGSSQQKYSMIV